MWKQRLGWWLSGLLAGLMLVYGLWGSAASTQAQTPTPDPPQEVTDDQVNAIAKQLYCPVCEGIPLDTCGTQACEDWRQLIRQKLEEGWTEDQILTFFVERYGERVLATPRPRGPHILVYVLPPVFVVAGVVILARVLRSWRMEGAVGEGDPLEPAEDSSLVSVDEDYRKRLEEEFRRRL